MVDAAFRIRRAVPADLDALVGLEQSAFTTDRLSRRQFRRHMQSTSAAVLAAVEGGTMLGNAVVFFRSGTRSARLYSIAVARTERGRGLGEALLSAAESAARGRGANRLRLEVRPDNRAAIRLYERRGYRRFGACAGFYEDGADAWRYEKVLKAKG